MELRSETTAERETPIRGSKAEVARVRETLWRIIDVAGLSVRGIERRLASEGQGMDLNRLLTGRFQLKLYQILDVLRVLEIHPVEFFRLVFKEPAQRNPLLERMREIFGAVRPPAVAPPANTPGPEATVEALRRRVDELARLVDQLRGPNATSLVLASHPISDEGPGCQR
jgi:hypothetical protein